MAPEYTRSWGGKVRRTTEADLDGMEYNRSIPLSAIFWLKKPSEPEAKLVTTTRCANCRSRDYPCSRTDPCTVCGKKGLRCSYQGYIYLREKPSPLKIIIPSKKDRLASGDRDRNANKKQTVEKTSQSGRTPMNESTHLTPPRKRKNGNSIPLDNVKALVTHKRGEVANIALSDETSPKKRRALAGATTSLGKGNVSWTRTDMSSPNTQNCVDEIQVESAAQPEHISVDESVYPVTPGKATNENVIPPNNVSPDKPPKRRDAVEYALGDQVSPKKRRVLPGATTRKGNVSWTRAQMVSLNTQSCVSKVTAPKGPYIWSEDYTELLGAIPLLSAMNNGVSADVGPSPMILLDDAFWSGTWSRSNVIELKTARNFSCPNSSLKSVVKQSGDSAANSVPVIGEHLETSCPSADPDEELSDSDGELAYPEEEDDEDLQYLENPGTNDLERGDVRPGFYGSFPPRLSDDSVRMYLKLPVSKPPASSMVNPEEVPPVDVPTPVVEHQDSIPGVYVPEGYPDEISALVKAYEGGMPVSVIADTSWTEFPFEIYEKCRYAVLGFFHIVNIATTADSLPSTTSKNGTTRARGKVTWSFTLYWTQSGPLDPDFPINLDGQHQSSPPIPWWLSKESELLPNPPSTQWLIEPFYAKANILASAVMRDAYEDCHGRANASYRSWLCVPCGKLNVTDWISSYECSFCHSKARERRKRLIYPHSVRDRERFIPMWEPSTQIPSGVITEVETCENGLRRFTYAVRLAQMSKEEILSSVDSENTDFDRSVSRKSEKDKREGENEKGSAIEIPVDGIAADTTELTVELLFPGNRAELEKQADSLFVSFQQEVRMRFERTVSKATAGVYTFRVSPNELTEYWKPDGISTWKAAPECINAVGGLMANYAGSSLKREIDYRKLHLSVMAWLGESPVKTEIQANAEENAVMLMCLGADLDIVFAKPGEKRRQKKPKKGRQKAVEGIQEVMKDDEAEVSRAGINAEIWGDGGGRETNKALMASDRLRITLTHGSMLILSGCDIDLTVIRSDFAILIKLHTE